MPKLAESLGIELRPSGGRWGGLCPFHAERTPSFSVFEKGGKWVMHCFGCGAGGDIFEMYGRVKGCNFQEAIADLAGMVGLAPQADGWVPVKVVKREVAPPPVAAVVFPRLRRVSDETCAVLAALRGLSEAGIRAARDAGLLWGCEVGVLRRAEPGQRGRVYGSAAVAERMDMLEEIVRTWVVSEPCGGGGVMQFRRLDGEKWKRYNKETRRKEPAFKADTLGGSAWPVGAGLIGARRLVVLAEGGPDLLAAFDFLASLRLLETVAVCAMLGASVRISGEALGLFAGKRVLIFPHVDNVDARTGKRAGYEAALRWTEQLIAAGAEVSCFFLEGLKTRDGGDVGDLNEAVAAGDDECLRAIRIALDVMRPTLNLPEVAA